MIQHHSTSHKERQALVRLSERGGKRYYEDNYLSYLLKEELEQKIGNFAKLCFGECKICYKIPSFVFPYDFKADMTADEFLKAPCSMPQFYIYLPNRSKEREEWEEKLHNFRRVNAEKGYKIRGTLIFTDAEELIFSMDEDGGFRYMRWNC